MTAQRKPDAIQTKFDKPVIEKPENFDLEKGLETAMRIVRRNQEWVKEMAKK
jgi:hypothetical protein